MNVIRKIRNYIENKHVQGNKANYDWLMESKEQLESSLFAKPELVIKEDTDEGGYVAYYPDLPGCITCGETIEEAKANAIDAKDAWIEAVIGLTEEEKTLAKGYAELHSLSLAEAFKRALFEKIEDEYDLKVAKEAYDDYVKSGYKTTPASDFWEEFL